MWGISSWLCFKLGKFSFMQWASIVIDYAGLSGVLDLIFIKLVIELFLCF